MFIKKEILRRLSEHAGLIDQRIKENQQIIEASTIHKLILPFLRILEWESDSDQVEFQLPIKKVGTPDITLKNGRGIPVAIIEAKRLNEELSDQHMKQVMKYPTPARWVITTNGREIRIYDKRYKWVWGKLFMKFQLERFGEKRFGERHVNALWLLSRTRINSLSAVADKILEWENLVKEKIRTMRNPVVKEFLISMIKEAREEGINPQLIERAIKETRK
jgi:hypothetical protein